MDNDTGTGASTQTPTPEGGTGAAGSQKGDEGWREQTTRLRQELAEQKELNRRAVPFVQTALALQEQDQETYMKLVKGEKLTKAETKTVETTAAAAGITMEQFEAKLDERLGAMYNQQSADRTAAANMAKLDSWASKELPGYDNIKGSPTWNGVLSSVIGTIENGTFQVPETEEDPYRFAVKQTYEIIKSQNPELAKGSKVVAKTEAERVAGIVAAGRKPSSSKQSTGSDLDGLPDDIRETIEFTRGIGTKVGKKFSP